MFKLHGCNTLNWIKGGDKGFGQTTSKLIAICANYQCANCLIAKEGRVLGAAEHVLTVRRGGGGEILTAGEGGSDTYSILLFILVKALLGGLVLE